MSAPFPPDPPPASPSAQTNDAPTHDDDGFPVGGFDYVISSTSLPLTILSSALAIAGKSVLCHDQNTWYGGDEGYCSSSLKNSVKGSEGGLRVEECECDDSLSCQLDRDCVEVETPFGKGVVVESWRESHIKLPWGKLYAPALMREVVDFRRFNIPHIWGGVCWGNSAGVDCLIQSGVSKYLEFKTLSGLEMAVSSSSSPTSSSSTSPPKFIPIPASKGAVFSSPHLTPMEKRRLMRACRVAYDAVSGSAATEVNDDEKNLKYSSSMPRPQNARAVGEGVASEGDWKEWLTEECGVESGMVRDILSYGLTLTPDANTTTKGAMALLHKHVSSLSVYDKDGTAFIVPMYGMAEIVQGFARRTSVAGGVMILACEGRAEGGEIVLNSVGAEEVMFKDKRVKIRKGVIDEVGEVGGGSRVWRVNCLIKGGREELEAGIIVHPPGYGGLTNPVHVVYGGAGLKWTNHRNYTWVTASVLVEESEADGAVETLKRAVEGIGSVVRLYTIVTSYEVGDGNEEVSVEVEEDGLRRFKVPRAGLDMTIDSAVSVAANMYEQIRKHDDTITTGFFEGGVVENGGDGEEDWEAERMEEAGKTLEATEDNGKGGDGDDSSSDDDSDDSNEDDELSRAVAGLNL